MSGDTLSLYFKLEPGEKADLEIVASAAIHWSAMLRNAVASIEPGAKLKVAFVDAKESSLSINTALDWIEEQIERVEVGSGQYPRLRRLALALSVFLLSQPAAVILGDYIKSGTIELSKEDRKVLTELLEKTRQNPVVEAERRKFFQTLEEDRSIAGVGVTEHPDDPPIFTIPKNQFAERGGLFQLVDDQEADDERTNYPVMQVTLVMPALVPAPRSWTFVADGFPEFTAIMKDQSFLRALELDHVRERLRMGIRMTLRLEIKEEKINGVWRVKRKGRSVIEVISPKAN